MHHLRLLLINYAKAKNTRKKATTANEHHFTVNEQEKNQY